MFEVASIWTLQSSPSVKVVDVPGLIGDDIHSLGGGSPGLVVQSEGSNPGAGYWMDIFHINLL